MKSEYAYMISRRTTQLMMDTQDKVIKNKDLVYLHTILYPQIACEMYKGGMSLEILGCLLTAKLTELLQKDGFTLRTVKDSTVIMNICWGMIEVFNSDGDSEYLTSREYNEFVAKELYEITHRGMGEEWLAGAGC